MHKAQDGFTLVELLVVMIIIGVLAAIAIPALNGAKSKAQEAAVKSDVKQIAKEVVAYYIDGKGPLSVSGTPDGKSWTVTTSAGVQVAQGRLSDRNSVVSSSSVVSDDNYCISIRPAFADARPWRASPAGLALGAC